MKKQHEITGKKWQYMSKKNIRWNIRRIFWVSHFFLQNTTKLPGSRKDLIHIILLSIPLWSDIIKHTQFALCKPKGNNQNYSPFTILQRIAGFNRPWHFSSRHTMHRVEHHVLTWHNKHLSPFTCVGSGWIRVWVLVTSQT